MLKAIKRELKGALPMLWLALGIGWGSALVLEAVVNIITASSGFQDDGWLSIGGVVALGAVTLVFFVSGVVQFSSSFQLAITMGCTRRAYLFSALAANVVLALGAMLATWPISPLAWLAKQALFPAAPLEGGSLHSAMPALWVFEGHIWMLPLIALTAVAVGGVMGGVMQRFGQAGFWVVWVFSMLLGAGVGKVADIIAAAQNGLFFRIRQFFASIGALYEWQWALIWLAGALALAGAMWLLLRRAPVK